MKIVYSYNKPGYEGQCWAREISAASTLEVQFIPFNHQSYLDPRLYQDAFRLDALYQARNPALMRMYSDLLACIGDNSADAVIVANCPPYHPEFLRKLDIYKVLYSADDPGATYLINIPYLHAYDHVFFVAPEYSPDLNMEAKMRYAGMLNADWLPISVFDFEHDPARTREEVLGQERDIDVVYVGSFWRQKAETLAAVKRKFGRRCSVHGFFRLKHNVFMNVRYGFRGWVKPISHVERVAVYQRSRIGFNLHWNQFGLGNQRLYHLPANGVMQICDCAPFLGTVFEPGREVVGFQTDVELVNRIAYYLENDEERRRIALAGYDRCMSEYRFRTVTRRAADLIKVGMTRSAASLRRTV